jgi:hypothetical protein
MSRDDWERGTIALPARAWKGFRDAMAQAEKDRQTSLFALAQQLHALLVEAKKTAKRGTFEVHRATEMLRESGLHHALFARIDELGGDYTVLQSLQSKKDRRTLVVPKKKDFPVVPASKLKRLSASYEGHITFDATKRQVTWYTGENNHAVEEARDSYHGRRFFALLARVDWTRGSGGVLVGNDEYNQERDGADEGGNYITQTFGPLGEAERNARFGGGRIRRRRVRVF